MKRPQNHYLFSGMGFTQLIKLLDFLKRKQKHMKITVMYENVEDREYDSLEAAKADIIERVLDFGDVVHDVFDDLGQHFQCEWDINFVFHAQEEIK